MNRRGVALFTVVNPRPAHNLGLYRWDPEMRSVSVELKKGALASPGYTIEALGLGQAISVRAAIPDVVALKGTMSRIVCCAWAMLGSAKASSDTIASIVRNRRVVCSMGFSQRPKEGSLSLVRGYSFFGTRIVLCHT